jgi:hypothetical protein
MKLVAEVKTQTIENGFVILVAPHISPAAILVCREAGIGCMDLSGAAKNSDGGRILAAILRQDPGGMR